MQRNWTLGEPCWAWPDDVDETGCEPRGASRYLPVTQHQPDGYTWGVAKVFVDEGDDEMLSDARLIAAAPDLLAACKLLLGSMGGVIGKLNAVAYSDLRIAIMRAEGET